MRASVTPHVRFLSMATLLSVAAVAHAARVDSRIDLKVGAHATISVESDGGSISVEPGPAGAVTVEAEHHGRGDGAVALKAVSVRLDGNIVKIRYHREHNGSYSDSIDFRITAPSDSKIETNTGGGAVSVKGINGGVDVRTGGGGVQVSDVHGKIAVQTGGGGIDLDGVGGNIDASTGGGSISVRGALKGRNRVQTGGGSIHVAIPADSKLEVDATSGGGGAHNDFGLAIDGGHWGPPHGFHGKIGDGSGGSLEMRTGGGSVTLVRS